MNELLRDYWKYISGALLIHGVLAALLFVTVNFTTPSTPPAQLAIKAVVIDQSMLRQLSRQRDRQAEAQRQQEAAERERQQAEQDKRQQEELERQREREAEQLKQQQAERQRDIDREKQQQAQRESETKQRQAAEEQRKQQALTEQKRVAEIQQKQREAEQRRKTEADAKAQAAREAELQAQIAAEEGEAQAVNAGLESQYVAMIQQKVMRNWSKPVSAKPGLSCQVRVSQTTNGTVLSAEVGQCNGDAAVRQSIVTAVLGSSPLPAAPDPRVFQRNLVFKFEPKE